MTVAKITEANVKQIAIDQIIIGQRRRQKLGNIQALARSIEERGLLHPIIIRSDNELVSGERRLEACRRLGWKLIPARHAESLSDEELRAIELDENTQRLALADFESSKARLAQIRQAEAELKAKLEFRGKDPQKSHSRGRPKEPGSTRDVAEKTGISPKSQREIERHVTLAEQYPFLQRNGWIQHQVLEAGHELEKLPKEDRNQLATMLNQDAIPPKTSIQIIKNMGQKTNKDRAEIYRLASSDSEHNRNIALTEAANLPAPPDPALNRIRIAQNQFEMALKICVTEQFKQQIHSILDQIIDLEQQFTAFVRGKNGNTNRASA